MKDKPYIIDFKEDDKPIAIKDILMKYLGYWPWFLVSCILFLFLGFLYARYAPASYNSVAKIKILDEATQSKVLPDDRAVVNQNVRLTLENHVEVLKSFRLLTQVVEKLGLDIEYFESDGINDIQIWTAPFEIKKAVSEEFLEKPLEYEIGMSSSAFNILDKDKGMHVVTYNSMNSSSKNDLPFEISLLENIDVEDYRDAKFKVIIHQQRQATMMLVKDLNISTSEVQSDILSLALNGQSRERSEAVLNAIIANFDLDGLEDKKLVAKRTLEVIDGRFGLLSKELDSIESGKQDFKQSENLSYIQADADVSLQKKSLAESQVLKLETQLSLSKLLKKTVDEESDYNLLPADIGLVNSGLNEMVVKYNELARERQKLLVSAGNSHPKLKSLSQQLELGKQNILSTVNVYQSQLGLSLKQNNQEKSRAGYTFSKLPEKERMLRSIERQQSIKENLYLLLLKKREEAAITYEATSPSIKVIDYGLTSIEPIWPKKTIVYPLSLLLGLFMPVLILFVRSSFDSTIRSRAEIEELNPEVPVLIEIPFFDQEKSFANANDRSGLAEAFRILSTNTDYVLKSAKSKLGGKVIYMTSAIKEEGKTLLAMNLSLAYASMGKKVLLVGADLRNPQLHSYFDVDKKVTGLSDYLANPNLKFEDCVRNGFAEKTTHNLCLSGAIPENAPVLLSSQRFGEFMEKAKQKFDYVIVDTAPTMLVTDTLLISKYADVTLFAVRSGLTDKRLLQFSKELNTDKKLHNMAYILNAVGQSKEYNYNYGYGYGYDSNTTPKPWYKRYSKEKVKEIKKTA